MTNNPFGKQTFETIWLKHFKNSTNPSVFNSFRKIKFYKNKYFPLYINVGKNITNGMHYEIDYAEIDYQDKIFLIYDVPDYFNIEINNSSRLKLKKAKQYGGYSSNLNDFENYEDFFNSHFSANSRYKYKRNIKRLEACFDIRYKIYYGSISEEEYVLIFEHLKLILSRRFGVLGLENNILSKWDYYFELIFKMVLKNEAILNVIYNNDIPIGVSIGFLSDNVMFYAITSFDIDYSKFNLGHTSIIKLMQWCFDNEYKVFDFSKGQYDYKDRWTNQQYNYNCHILYDSKSIKAVSIATLIQSYFSFKQYLRDKKVNYLYSKLKFSLKNNNKKENVPYYIIENLKDEIVDLEGFVEIVIQTPEYSFLRAPLFDYIYKSPEKISIIKLYKSDKTSTLYYAIGVKNNLKITQT